MLIDSFQQGIDGHRLNLMWRIPTEPLSVLMFAQTQARSSRQVSKKVSHRLEVPAIPGTRVADRVADLKFETVIELDTLSRDARFLLGFAQSCVPKRFSWFAVSFGEVPAIEMAQEQELHLPTVDQHQQNPRSENVFLSEIGQV
jgi:hypothetical protein